VEHDRGDVVAYPRPADVAVFAEEAISLQQSVTLLYFQGNHRNKY